ncbi:hypothetical protein [Streptomyces sp. NPDC058683]|uniref:hypothetical protein n=1 Tax=Streptomyces sp. NPDC058683 TaxID=3346597 RepID=UPI00365C78F1
MTAEFARRPPAQGGKLQRVSSQHRLVEGPHVPNPALTAVRPPPYAPDLNPVEAAGWSLVRRAMVHTASDTSDGLDRTLRRELRKIQLRPT